jgi:uncharacterized protein YkwD
MNLNIFALKFMEADCKAICLMAFAAILLPLNFHLSAEQVISAAQPDLYTAYNWESFRSQPDALSEIDFKNINKNLIQAAVFHATNQQRIMYKLKPFIYSPLLEKTAMLHAEDMVKYNFFSHYNPVLNEHKSLDQRIMLFGKPRGYYAENLANQFAIQYKSGDKILPPKRGSGIFRTQEGKPIPAHTYISFAESVVELWMNSPGHRANILDEKLLLLGTGAVYFKDSNSYNMGKFKVAQVFATAME